MGEKNCDLGPTDQRLPGMDAALDPASAHFSSPMSGTDVQVHYSGRNTGGGGVVQLNTLCTMLLRCCGSSRLWTLRALQALGIDCELGRRSHTNNRQVKSLHAGKPAQCRVFPLVAFFLGGGEGGFFFFFFLNGIVAP